MRCDVASRRCVGQGGQQLRATLDGLGSHRAARRPRAVVAHRSPRGCRHTGAEFRLVVGAQAQWHQAERQRASGPWTVSALAATDGVLQPWWPKLSVGDRCVCVSGAGASELNELTERAAAAADWQEVSTEFPRPTWPGWRRSYIGGHALARGKTERALSQLR